MWCRGKFSSFPPSVYDGKPWVHTKWKWRDHAPFFLWAQFLALASRPSFHRHTDLRAHRHSVSTALACLAMSRAYADRVNNLLGAQPSVREFRSTCSPSSRSWIAARLFVVDARCPVWLLICQRYLSVSLAESDVVLPLTEEQKTSCCRGPIELFRDPRSRARVWESSRPSNSGLLYKINRWVVLDRAPIIIDATRDKPRWRKTADGKP